MTKLLPTLRKSLMILAIASTSSIFAANTTKTVSQVTSAVSLTEAVDYHITNTTPFATAGSIDIQNPEATVVFENIRPADVVSKYLSKVTVNGTKLTNNDNCRVSIYKQGAIVIAHSDTKNADGTAFYPLTTYAGDNCTGEVKTYNGDARRTTSGSFPFRSFVLKRGYMVTMANNPDGTGYSHCYIADHEDRTVQLRKELAGKVGFFRIFRWQWPSKKGSCDVGPNELDATWHYNWGAGRSSDVNYEYVPQRHHEAGNQNDGDWSGAWESWTNINGSDGTCVHVLGQNEPDNTSGKDEVYTYVTSIPANPRENHATSTLVEHAHEFLYSGKRIGTFACCNPSTGWVSEYVNWCRANNIRVDFVATHYYIGGQSPQGCIDRLWQLHNVTGLPVWVTEWNNGANWTTEGGFQTDSEGWHTWINKASYNETDSRKNGVWLTDVLKRADKDENHWLERLAVYSAVEYNRQMNYNGSLSAGGKLYKAYNSDFAYDERNEYFMTWNHKSPSDLALAFATATKRAKLTWNNPNGKQTDSISIERKVENESNDWVTIAKIINPSGTALSYQDTLTNKTGVITYRVKNHDSDGKTRMTGEVNVTIGSATGNSMIQYGNLTVPNTDVIQTDFATEFAETPGVFMGTISYKNTGMHPTNLISSATKKNFKYNIFPLQNQGDAELTKDETIPFMAVQLGNYTFGDMDIEIDSVKIKSDTTIVKFIKPFPEGVTPVVITELKPSTKTKPFFTKIWDVTNEGFKATAFYEAAENATVRSAQPFFYAAFTPGTECIDEEKGIVISAGISTSPLYGSTARPSYFTNGEDTVMVKDPLVFTTLQTSNYASGTILRRGTDLTVNIDGEEYLNGIRIRRYVDDSVEDKPKNNAASADYVGWMTITSAPALSTGIEEVITVSSENPIEVEVINRCIYVKNRTEFEVYTLSGVKVAPNATQEPGIYLVRSGKQTAKVVVN